MEAFLERFKTAWDKANCNMPYEDLVIHYLSTLGDNVFTQILLDISDGMRDNWWKHGLETTHHNTVEHL